MRRIVTPQIRWETREYRTRNALRDREKRPPMQYTPSECPKCRSALVRSPKGGRPRVSICCWLGEPNSIPVCIRDWCSCARPRPKSHSRPGPCPPWRVPCTSRKPQCPIRPLTLARAFWQGAGDCGMHRRGSDGDCGGDEGGGNERFHHVPCCGSRPPNTPAGAPCW